MPTDSEGHQPFVAENLQASLTVADLPHSVAWYRDALGFNVDREYEREGKVFAVALNAGPVLILLTHDNGAQGLDRVKGQGMSLQFSTHQNIDALAARARGAGATFDTEPMDMMGARVFRLRDPDGFRLVISSVRQR